MPIVPHHDPIRARTVHCLLDEFWGDYCQSDRNSQMIGDGPLTRITRTR